MRKTLLLIASLTAALCGAYALAARELSGAGLHMNYSDSVPVGLYRETLSRRLAAPRFYAGFCLPESTFRSFSAGDLERVAGDCPGHLAPVLKPLVEATREHPVTLSEQGFSLGSGTLPNTAPRRYTRSGAALVHYPFGTYASGLWAISTYNPNSYDSRYFGPVQPAEIRFYAVPFLTD